MADDVAEVAYAVAFDGVPPLFVTNEGLNNAWAIAGGFASAYTGLIAPSSLPCGTDIRLGELDDSDAVIQLEDIDGTLAALFGSAIDDSDVLITTLEPGVTAGASLFSKHVGHEAIGSAGQRRRYSCVPGFNVGLRHLGQQHAYSLGHGPTPVTDLPVLWPGRRVAVYRVKKLAGVWEPLADSTRVWFGTLLGQGEQDGGTWSFKCAGPESWAGGNLGGATWETPREVEPAFSLDNANEELVTVILRLVRLDDLNDQHHEWVGFYDDTTTMIGVTNYADAVSGVNAILATVEADGSSGDVYAEGDSSLRYSDEAGNDGFMVQWNRDVEDASGFVPAGDPSQYVVWLSVIMHEKLWLALGYDVRQQNEDLDPVDQEDTFSIFHQTNVAGRWIGYFFSADAKAMAAYVSPEQDFTGLTEDNFTNGQFERRWPPLFPLGAVSWSGQAGQEFTLRNANDPVHMLGSLSRPIMADPNDATAAITISSGVGLANRQGLMVIDGPYRRRGDDDKLEPVEGYAFELERERREGRTIQVVRVCWREGADGSIVTDSDGRPRLVIYRWENPKLFGFDYSKIQGTWGAWRDAPDGAKGLTARPLTVFDHGDAGDRIDLVLQRVLATTGTAGLWYSDSGLTVPLFGLYPDEVYLDAGANDYTASIPIDAEAAELGLGVPASMIQSAQSWADALDDLPGPNLRRCKAAFASAVSARHFMRTILSPTGVCMSLAGGKFGLFDPWRMPVPDDADAIIDSEWYAGTPGDPTSAIPSQDFRVFAPIDRLDVKARIEPVEGKPLRSYERKATDFGSRYRSQTIRHSIAGDHLVHPLLKAVPGADWQGEINERWRAGFDFWGRQHFAVPLELHAEDAIDLWPGNSILLTDQWLADPAGEYGISIAPGWIVSRNFDCQNEKVLIRVIVNAQTDFRMWSPAAVAVRYDENDDAQGYRLEVEDDWLGFRLGASFDCQGFAEPTWSAEGGDADVEVFEFDGTTWTRGIFGTVTSITAAVGACYLNLDGALTGATYYRDRHHVVVLREFADQAAAWVLEFFAPVCLEDGTHSTGEPGIKLRS
jgi:hypothetical protein